VEEQNSTAKSAYDLEKPGVDKKEYRTHSSMQANCSKNCWLFSSHPRPGSHYQALQEIGSEGPEYNQSEIVH
jgi:hypothetical protein